MEDMVEEAMHKLTGQTHDNLDISEKLPRKGSLRMQNIYRRAPYLDTHVPQQSQRYEIAKLMCSGMNPDLELDDPAIYAVGCSGAEVDYL